MIIQFSVSVIQDDIIVIIVIIFLLLVDLACIIQVLVVIEHLAVIEAHGELSLVVTDGRLAHLVLPTFFGRLREGLRLLDVDVYLLAHF